MEVRVPKLTLEQEELLRAALDNKEEMRVVYQVIEDLVYGYEQSVNKVMVTDAGTERDLLYKRLKAEGARKLLSEIGKLFKLKG